MPKTLTTLKNPSFAKLAVKLLVMAFLVVVLLATEPARATDRLSCVLGTSGGITRTVSCGSSAGNFVIACSSSGCVDETGSNATNQAIADGICAQFESDGCPDIQLEGSPVN